MAYQWESMALSSTKLITLFIVMQPHEKLTKIGLLGSTGLLGQTIFAAMALAQMDVKVSPYYALLTKVAEDIPATSLPTNGTAKNNSAHQGGTDFVNARGKHVKLTPQQKKLFHDYQLVQYDLTAGHHYLLKDSFLKSNRKIK